MATVTLPEKEYQSLKKRAFLYERVFRVFSERIFGIESYSQKQVEEFFKEDRIDKKTAQRLGKLVS